MQVSSKHPQCCRYLGKKAAIFLSHLCIGIAKFDGNISFQLIFEPHSLLKDIHSNTRFIVQSYTEFSFTAVKAQHNILAKFNSYLCTWYMLVVNATCNVDKNIEK